MNPVIEVTNLTKRYRDVVAVDDVSFTIEKDTIYGLLGRNGAGKTTVMSILTAQNFATSGKVSVFGEKPYENARVLSRMCFVRESQKYPDDAKPTHAFRSARLFFPHWDDTLAKRLIADFQLPVDRRIKKLSRGQLSAVGRHHRTRLARRDHLLRRALPRAGCRSPPDLLRSASRGLRASIPVP